MHFVKDLRGIIQRWFAYGLQTLQQYCLRWHSRCILFVLLFSALYEHNEKKRTQVYVYIKVMLFYLRLVLCFRTIVIGCNSSWEPIEQLYSTMKTLGYC